MTAILVPDGRKLGWLHEEEDEDWLDSLPQGLPFASGDYKPVAAFPHYKPPSEWIKVEDQNGFGSCQGHALSSCVEISYYFETGQEIQLSRWYAYVRSQLEDGIKGDRGSTISAGGRVAMKYGLPREEFLPYPKKYSQRVPREADDDAVHYRVANAVRLHTYDEITDFVAAGLGGVDMGVRWGRGGHAIAVVEVNPDGSWKLLNSWSERWGNKGYFTWSKREAKGKCSESYTRAVGITDMVQIQPREAEWGKPGVGTQL